MCLSLAVTVKYIFINIYFSQRDLYNFYLREFANDALILNIIDRDNKSISNKVYNKMIYKHSIV